MSKSKLLPGHGRFEFRPSVKGFTKFKGINRQLDPGAIPPNQFYTLQNVRLVAEEVESRGGLDDVTGLLGGLLAIFDDENEGEVDQVSKVYWGNAAGGDSWELVAYHPDQNPPIQSALPTTNIGKLIEVFNGRVQCLSSPGGLDQVLSSFVYASGGEAPVATTDAVFVGENGLSSALTFESNLYLLHTGNGLEYILYKWNGSVLALEDSSGFTTTTEATRGLALASIGTTLYYLCGGDIATAGVRRRVAGVWSTLCSFVPPTPASADTAIGDLVASNSNLYAFTEETIGVDASFFPQNVARAYLIDAGGAALVHTVDPDPATGLTNLAAPYVYNGYLYYLSRFSDGPTMDTPTYTAHLGRFDGVTWDDQHASPFPVDSRGVVLSVDAGGNLIALVATTGGVNKLYTSTGTNTATAAWSEVSHTLPNLGLPETEFPRAYVL